MYITIDIDLLSRNDLTSNEKIIASLISNYDRFPQNHTLISRITGISRTTTIKCIQNLLQKKVIVAEQDHYYLPNSTTNMHLKYIPKVKRLQDIKLNPNVKRNEPLNIDLELKALLDAAYPKKR